MAKTIEMAKRSYAQKLPVMPAHYNDGMNAFFGKNVSSSAPAQNYAGVVKPGLENRWETRLKEAFGA